MWKAEERGEQVPGGENRLHKRQNVFKKKIASDTRELQGD